MKSVDQRLAEVRRPLSGKRITVVGEDGFEVDNLRQMAEEAVTVTTENSFDLIRDTEPSDHDAIVACTNFSMMRQSAGEFLAWIDAAGEDAPVVVHFGHHMSLEPAFVERIESDPKWVGPILNNGEYINVAQLLEQIAEML